MAELIAISPAAGLLPLTCGPWTLHEVPMERMTSVAPFRGQVAAVSDLLLRALGLGFPAPNTVTAAGSLRALWIGPGRALLIGAPVPDGVAGLAALTDQSDALAVLRLTGPGADAVLSRLVPVDLRLAAFGPGCTMRSLVGHMMASITRIADDEIEVMVMRSMAATLVHEVEAAMRMVAARAAD